MLKVNFSVTYQDKKYDESKWSKLVAEKYSSNHQNSQLIIKKF